MRITLTLTDPDDISEVKAIAAREKHTVSRMAAILLEQAIKDRKRKRKTNGSETTTEGN